MSGKTEIYGSIEYPARKGTPEDKSKHRYIIYSMAKGIFLGETYWSGLNHNQRKVAPTYTVDEAKQVIDKLNEGRKENPISYTMVMVFPSQGNEATMDDVANQGLPRWD
jgi:hypothetical protein